MQWWTSHEETVPTMEAVWIERNDSWNREAVKHVKFYSIPFFNCKLAFNLALNSILDFNILFLRFPCIPRLCRQKKLFAYRCLLLFGLCILEQRVVCSDCRNMLLCYFDSLALHIPLPDDNLSIADHADDCNLKRLNERQLNAVKISLRGRFTLIQGPPGMFVHLSQGI